MGLPMLITAAPAKLTGWVSPARYTGLRSDRPVALIAYHMEKTGGSALMKWLHKYVKPEEPRLTSLWDYAHTFCFFGFYPGIFPTWSRHWEDRCAPGSPGRLAWETSAVAVEFHAYTMRRFWDTLVPRLPQLRALYRERNGSLVTFTLIRDPAAHILSTYRMWPPHVRIDGSKHVTPFQDWLHVASGLQAAVLCVRIRNRPRNGFHNPDGCGLLNESRRRLETFDVAGPMACMQSVLLGLSRLLGWTPHGTLDRKRLHWALSESLSNARPSGVSVGGVLWREARAYSALDKLNASVRGALRATADCDMHLYVDALRRSAPLFERFRSFGDEGSRTCARRELLRVEAETARSQAAERATIR
jgi:hypothetical protein